MRINGQSLLVGRPALVVPVFRQQVGAEILENQRGLGVELERLAVKMVGRAIVLERGVDRPQIIQNLRVARIELQRLLIAASGVFGVEHHLVVNAHLVPDVGCHLGGFGVCGNGGLVALVSGKRVANFFVGRRSGRRWSQAGWRLKMAAGAGIGAFAGAGAWAGKYPGIASESASRAVNRIQRFGLNASFILPPALGARG